MPDRIDIHAHWYPDDWVRLLEREAPAAGAQVSRNPRGELVLSVPQYGATFQQSYIDIPSRLAHMDAARVDMHALSMTQPMVYWAPADLGDALARAFNDGLSAAHRDHPDRFCGLATLPMQDTDRAVAEVHRAASLPGLRGVYLCTHVLGRNLDDADFQPVFAACAERQLPVFLHPVNPVGGDRMRGWHLRNLIGNPTDTGIAAAALIFGGVLDRLPTLDVVLPHAGGVLPMLVGRWDHGARVRRELAHLPQPPSAYLRRFHYDTIAHDDAVLRFLVERVGADRVMMGSDCPADMSYTRPVDVVERLADLPATDRELILGGNARRLLRIGRQ
jgi:aminocarboxymuconate-semialdehyde decarboxylase